MESCHSLRGASVQYGLALANPAAASRPMAIEHLTTDYFFILNPKKSYLGVNFIPTYMNKALIKMNWAPVA